MFKFLCRHATRSSLASNLNTRLQTYASFTLRDVVHESSDETGTLITRFAKYISMERYNDAARQLVPTTIRYADYFPITDERYLQRELQKTPADQIPALIIYASSYRSNAQPVKYMTLLNELDTLAIKQLNKMEMQTVLETLYSFLFLIPNWIMRLDFYEAAMKRLVTQDFTDDAAKESFVQICFYLGLAKKHNKATSLLEQFLETHLQRYLPELSNMDLAVIANAAYKTSTIVNNCPEFNERIIEAVLQLPLTLEAPNDALLTTYLKSLRLQRIRSERICLQLAELCKQPAHLKHLELRGLAHLFAYFVEQQWDREDCITAITTQFFAELDKATQIRAKDLATFTWCCAQFNCTLSKERLQQLEDLALQKLDDNEYKYFADNLVDTCLSLWSLGHHSRELLNAAVDLKNMQTSQRQRTSKSQPKVDSRLTVLLAAAEIEQPTWNEAQKSTRKSVAFNINGNAPAYLMKENTELADLCNNLKSNEQLTKLQSAKCVCPINGINIPSILIKRVDDSIEFIELLKPNQILQFSEQPISLIRLKLRLLQALGHNVNVLKSTKMEQSIADLQQTLINNDATETVSERETARSI